MKGFKLEYALCILLCTVICRISFSQQSNEEILQKTEKEILALMDKGDIPGLSITIVKNGKELTRNYGYSDMETHTPVTLFTLFELGSCSKAFTAMAIAGLQRDGKLQFDSYISDYIPWFETTFKGKPAKITIRELLHHTSGIPWYTISDIPETTSKDALVQTVRQLIGQELNHLPGTRYEYATVNYDILALVIQVVTKQPFEIYVQNNIFNILKLQYTSVGIPSDSSLMSSGYKIGFFKPRKYEAPRFSGNNAAGYIISNAYDMATWLKIQMGIIDTEFYNLAKVTHQRDETVPLHNMSSYAMGWDVALDGTGEVHHAGMNPNFSSYLAFRPQEKIGIALLANSNSRFTPVIGNLIMKAMLGEEMEKELDPGDGGDRTYSSLTIAILAYVMVVLGFLGLVVIDTIKNKRSYEPFTRVKFIRFTVPLLLIVPCLYGLYIVPKAMAGFTWKSAFVWTPFSFATVIISALVALVITYFTHYISLCFPEKDEFKRAAPQIILTSVLSGLSNAVIIVLVTSALDSEMELKYFVLYYTLALCVYLLGRKFVQTSIIKFNSRLIYQLRIKLTEKIFSTSYYKFEKLDRGRIYTVLNDDVSSIGESTNTIVMLMTSIITVAGAFIYLASLAFWATASTIILVISLAVIYYLVGKSSNIYFEKARDARDVFMRLINGMIDGFKEISLSKKKKIAYKEDVAMSANEYREKISTADIKFVNAFLVGESLLVMLLGMVSFGIPELFPSIERYTIMSFVIILLYLIGPINGILGSVPGLMRLKVAWGRIQKFLKEIPANLELSSLPEVNLVKVQCFQAKGLRFEYKNENTKENFYIGPIDLEINKGEILFIIGGNGSGKTTLAKLLTGLYEPDEGAIMINGRIVKGSELSEHFSTVFSPPYLFQKLYAGNHSGNDEDIDKYLRLLDLCDKVEIKDNKYSTIDLSNGQRKRLALLQCYLEDLPIYLFDEWAADQDPAYRKFFYRTLLPEMKRMGKIVIAITHDDHYFDIADRVLKMDQGKLQEHDPQILNASYT